MISVHEQLADCHKSEFQEDSKYFMINGTIHLIKFWLKTDVNLFISSFMYSSYDGRLEAK